MSQHIRSRSIREKSTDEAVTSMSAEAERPLASPISADCTLITPNMLDLVELDQDQINAIVSTVPGGALNVQDIYPPTSLQEGMLFHRLLSEEKSDSYVLSTLIEFAPRANVDLLVTAVQETIDRHDVLRTALLWQDLPRPVQVVYRRAGLRVDYFPLDPERDSAAQIQEWMSPVAHALDLRSAPLVSLQLFTEHRGRVLYGILRVHHLVCDHQSLRAIVAEVMSRVQGQAVDMAPPTPFRVHLEQSLGHQTTHDSIEFFRRKLSDIHEPTAPFGVIGNTEDSGQVNEVRKGTAAQLAQDIRFQARRYNVSAARLFHSAWAIAVARTCGRGDVVYGTVILAERQRGRNGRRMLGMSINTLPLRVRLKGLTVRQLVERTACELTELLGHEQASLAVAQSCSGVPAGTPLFTSILNFRHSSRISDDECASAAGLRVIERREAWTNYPIAITIDDFGDGFDVTAQVDHRLDAHRITDYLLVTIRSLVWALQNAPETLAATLAVLPVSEQRKVLEDFNASSTHYPRRPIHRLFEEQVRHTPHQTAVIHGEESLTYERLNARANQLARYLETRGVRAGHIVAVCTERSVDMLVSMLGILKAGAAYMPIDPNYPRARLEYMLEDASPRIVITQLSLQAALPRTKTELVSLEDVRPEISALSTASLDYDNSSLEARSLVYVIYTSGSTGQPKGIAMPHLAMVNLIEWHRIALPMTKAERVLQYAALGFDVAFQETFSTLCNGGTLVLVDEWVRKDPRALVDFLNDQQIHRLFAPPLVLQSLAEQCAASGQITRSLHDVVVAGEQLRIDAGVARWFSQLKGTRLHNHYGPTETHVVTALTLPDDPSAWPTLPSIGRPISNSRIYILDESCQPVPIGVMGEIYVGGTSPAQGYLYRPALTAQRFLADPFTPDGCGRMYGTGDLARWGADGTVEYLGRGDDQVKIRGYRVELGEIEAHLSRHEEIMETAVLARADAAGERRLVAYVTLRNSAGLGSDEIRVHLKDTLPEHMIPTTVVVLERMPLTPSGKLDRRALPAPDLSAYGSASYESPQGLIEHVLAEIWQGLLGVSRVGRHDDFFILGGNSLLAMRTAARVRSLLIIDLPIKLMFERRTLIALSAQIDRLRRKWLLDALSESAEVNELRAAIASMPEGTVQQLLLDSRAEERP